MKVLRAVSVLLAVAALAACAVAAPKQSGWRDSQSAARRNMAESRFVSAYPLAQQELAGAEKAMPADSPELAGALADIAETEYRLDKFEDAQAHLQRALAIRQHGSAVPDKAVAGVLIALGKNEDSLGDLQHSEAHLQDALAILGKIPGGDKALKAEALDALAGTQADGGKSTDAVKPMVQEALDELAGASGDQRRLTAHALDDLAYIALLSGDDATSRSLLGRALGVVDTPDQPLSPELLDTLDYLADVELDAGAYARAQPLLTRALDISEAMYGESNEKTAGLVNDIARMNDDMGNNQDAERFYERALAIYVSVDGPDSSNVATVRGNLSGVYLKTDRYEQAAGLLQQTLETGRRNPGPDNGNLALALNNLGTVYYYLGRYADAASLMQQALDIYEKQQPFNPAMIANTTSNLSATYVDEQDYAKALPLAEHALQIAQQSSEKNARVLELALIHVAQIHDDLNHYNEAQSYYGKALDLAKTSWGESDPDVGHVLDDLGRLHLAQRNYAQADRELSEAVDNFTRNYGPKSLALNAALTNYTRSQYAQGHWQKAGELFAQDLDQVHEQLLNQFPYMSERDKLAFSGVVYGDTFDQFFSFCLQYRGRDAGCVGRMYDALLWQKGFVGQSIAAMRAKIAASGDVQAEALLEKLAAEKIRLASLLNAPSGDHAGWQQRVDQLRQEADDTEKQVIQRSASLAQEKQLQEISWRDVQKSLKPGEAAVEFVRFRYSDGIKFNGDRYYVALVVTPATRDEPEFIVVGKADELELAAVEDYAGRLNKFGAPAGAGKTTFYRAFWQPLEPALTGITRVYLSPDGILNQASLGIVPDDQGKLLLERYDLRIVPSTRDVLRVRTAAAADTAVLLGGPDFDLAPQRYLSAVAELAGIGVEGASRYAAIRGSGLPVARDLSAGGKCPLPNTGILCPLPGAAEEVSGIDTLLTRKQWQASLYQGDRGLEEVIQAVHHPRLLHIATHGFFLPDQKTLSEDPMLRSGLYFAGADNTLAGNPPPEGADNGVLTAYEAEQLDLEGTELVVLSACDTGLGTAQSGEGVFGLNRALQEAGAQAVIMSMWSVPDQETRELMQLFYANWLGGMEKHEALRQAELAEREAVKQRYGHDLPYYWGAFVMVGR